MAPSISALGNGATVAELESQLLGLAYRHPNDLRSADILRRAGDRQVELLRLYALFTPDTPIALPTFVPDRFRA